MSLLFKGISSDVQYNGRLFTALSQLLIATVLRLHRVTILPFLKLANRCIFFPRLTVSSLYCGFASYDISSNFSLFSHHIEKDNKWAWSCTWIWMDWALDYDYWSWSQCFATTLKTTLKRKQTYDSVNRLKKSVSCSADKPVFLRFQLSMFYSIL